MLFGHSDAGPYSPFLTAFQPIFVLKTSRMQGDCCLANVLHPRAVPKGHLDPYAVEASINAVTEMTRIPGT